jgi:xanthine/uracil/vitamin C permease (AzgA family)
LPKRGLLVMEGIFKLKRHSNKLIIVLSSGIFCFVDRSYICFVNVYSPQA